MSWAHIAKYVDVSRKKIIDQTKEDLQGVSYTEDQFNSIVESKIKREIRDGVQTFQYQVVSMSGSNGQSPFISMSLNFDECENEQHRNDMALVIEEVLNQRIAGFKDRNGINVAPLFPKLLYFLDESNAKPGSKYYYLTQLAVKCVSIRMAPDFISTKVQKSLKGIEHSYPCMGCVDGKSIVKVKLDNIEYVMSFEDLWNTLSNKYTIENQFGIKDNPNVQMALNNIYIWDNKESKYVDCKLIIKNRSNDWYTIDFTKNTVICPDEEFEIE